MQQSMQNRISELRQNNLWSFQIHNSHANLTPCNAKEQDIKEGNDIIAKINASEPYFQDSILLETIKELSLE